MVEAIHAGKLKASYLIGEDMSLVDANANFAGDTFSKLQFFVVQDIFLRFKDLIEALNPPLRTGEGSFLFPSWALPAAQRRRSGRYN